MSDRLNLGSAYAAGSMAEGAADALEQLLARKRMEQLDRQRQRERDEERQYRYQRDAEATRRWQQEYNLRESTVKDAAARRKGEDDQRAAQRAELDRLLADPSALSQSGPAWQRLARLNRLGAGSNLNQHAVELPEEHAAHLKAETDAKWGDTKREIDYRENLQRTRPVRQVGRLRVPGADDPELPRGVQSHLVQIRSRQPSFEAALGELQNSFDAHRQAHPRMSDMKVVNALRQLYTGAAGAGAGGGDDLLDALLGGDDDAGGFDAGAVPSGAASQSAGPAAAAGAGPAAPAASDPAMERQFQVGAASVLRSNGIPPTPENINKFLRDPNNRRALLTGGQ